MCGRPGAGPARSELKSRVWRPRIGSISRRRRLCSRKLAARRRIGLSNRFRASNQAARSGWRCRSARVAFSASFGRVPIPKDISRLWFKIRFGREPPTRSEQRKKRSRQASDRLGPKANDGPGATAPPDLLDGAAVTPCVRSPQLVSHIQVSAPALKFAQHATELCVSDRADQVL